MTALANASPEIDVRRLCHDLRQYAAAGLLAADMPGDECLDETVRRRLHTIHQLFSSMQDLIAVHTGAVRPSECVVDLGDLVAECISVVELNHAVPVVLDRQDPVRVLADPAVLRRAVANVLDNAARATRAGGRVTVRVGAEEGCSSVEVADEGLGFGHAPPGTGQGLSIVDMAVRACRGRLEIASGPGPGTTVRLVLPDGRNGRGIGDAHESRAV
jgi:signal transduction histidine kinase